MQNKDPSPSHDENVMNKYDKEFRSLLQTALNEGLLNVKSPAYAVAQQYVEFGMESLTWAQREVLRFLLAPQRELMSRPSNTPRRRAGDTPSEETTL